MSRRTSKRESRADDETAAPAPRLGLLERILLGVLPAEDGGPPPALDALRARLLTLVLCGFGLVIGAAAGFVVALVVAHAPDVPVLVVGFGVGTLLGAGVAVLLASRIPGVRRAGAVVVLASPLLVLLAPFMLLVGGALLVARWPRWGGGKR